MNVMKRAWEIAREGQNKFGGKVKEYFAQALRIAWAEVKAPVISEQIVLIADHDKKEYTVAGERNGKVFWKKEAIEATDREKYLNAYNHLIHNEGIKTVSFYVIKNGEKKFLETKVVA